MYLPKQLPQSTSIYWNANGTVEKPSGSSGLIEAWESEGGSCVDARGGFDAARAALREIVGWQPEVIAGWPTNHADEDTPKDVDDQDLALAAEEDQILRCLGAAVIKRWNAIPTKLQRELFNNASSMGELLQDGALAAQIARFLHKHKDDVGLIGRRALDFA